MGWTIGKPPRARVLVGIAVVVLLAGAAVVALGASERRDHASEGIASGPVDGAGSGFGAGAFGRPSLAGDGAPPPGDGAPSPSSTASTVGTAGAPGGVRPADGSSTTGAVTGTTRAGASQVTTTTMLVVRIPSNAPDDQGPVGVPSSCTVPADTGYAGQLASAFAAHRAGRGLPAMERSAALDAVALAWARTLACTGGLRHNPDLEGSVLGACGPCTGWAENVAYDSGGPTAMWNGWLASGSHRENIEDPHAGVYGIAVVRAASGTYYGVQDFGRYP